MDDHLGVLAKKVRNRSDYSFANINLLGSCNVDCYFCLGLDLGKQFNKFEHTKTHFLEWANWDAFIEECRAKNIKQIYLTGQNTDALMYSYIGELIEWLTERGFYIGCRTNGLLAKKKMDLINRMTTCNGDAVSYSVHTIRPETNQKIMRINFVPDWDWIFKNTTAKFRAAIVVNRFNRDEFFDVIEFLSHYENIEYIQARRICTDNRYDALEEDMRIFEELEKMVAFNYRCVSEFETAKTYEIFGKKVNFWRTVKTTVNSINYFTDGTLSDNYFVIEGYSERNNIRLGTEEYLVGEGLGWKTPSLVRP